MCRFLFIYYRQINTFTAILQEFSAGITYIDGYLLYYSVIYTANLGCFMYSLLIQGNRTHGNQLFLLRILVGTAYFMSQPYILYSVIHILYTQTHILRRIFTGFISQIVSFISQIWCFLCQPLYIIGRKTYLLLGFNIMGVIFTEIIADFMLDLLIYYYIDTQTLIDYYLGN